MTRATEILATRLGVDRVLESDLVVLGSGVAGMAVALAAAGRSVTVVSKGELRSGSSPWAQGGIAAAVAPEDSPAEHARDTLRVARGLALPEVVEAMTEAAPAAIERLIELGARFDLTREGELSLGREGGHSQDRILHAGGDATGAEIVRTMAATLRRREDVRLEEHLFAVDLLLAGDRAVGVLALRATADGRAGERLALLARDGVVVATGGLGRLYRHTTNPPEVTGDGIAMAARAGARLVDLEFVQFHPTVLDVSELEHDGPPPASPLLTEALRGAGARLVDERSRRFMIDVHPDAELAPRDLVARTIWHQRSAGHGTFLDLRPLASSLAERFPTVLATCLGVGVDPRLEPVPVSPAAHYFMGGIDVDADGRSSLAGLWACGEAASSGAHGANRLASNSLLEALVFGARVARSSAGLDAMAPDLDRVAVAGNRPGLLDDAPSPSTVGEATAAVRDLAWRDLGVERSERGLLSALDELETMAADFALPAAAVRSRQQGELRNLLLIAQLVAHAAILRAESRGSHYRLDAPDTRRAWQHRLRLRLETALGGSVSQRLRVETPLPEGTASARLRRARRAG